MYEFKLQIGCLIIVMYVVISYIRNTYHKQVSGNKVFHALLWISPWAIIFDGVTAWTVNHMDVVPEGLNLAFHLMFFVSMDIVIILVYIYVLAMTIDVTNPNIKVASLIPGIISILGIFLFAGELYYIHGKTTWYSMGYSAISCYASLVLHGILILVLLYIYRNAIVREKLITLRAFFIMILVLLAIQVFLPESLISSLLPMVAVVGIYVSFEDPSIKKLERYNEETVAAFATLVENRDNRMSGHIKRTKEYVTIILEEMNKSGKYTQFLTKDYMQNVIKAAPMHDIGKISTPDKILQKQGRLTYVEYTVMKEHTTKGSEIIRETFSELEDKQYQKIAYEMARYHHEKWDGKGYPEGLRGEEIPLHARIMAIADAFDGISSKTCYHDAKSLSECFEQIEEESGNYLDPKLVNLFIGAKDRITVYYMSQSNSIKEIHSL